MHELLLGRTHYRSLYSYPTSPAKLLLFKGLGLPVYEGKRLVSALFIRISSVKGYFRLKHSVAAMKVTSQII
jgi:hypothetical protein